MKVKISLIMPVYNVENYIKKSIESVLEQSFREFELIIIDDGSTDKSGEICNEYAKKDERIKIIKIENSGQACARNLGLEIAVGRYIGFVDSDDFIEKFMYEEMYNSCITSNSDISVIGLREVDENNNCLSEYIPETLSLSEILKRAYPCNKLIKRSLFNDNNLKFVSKRYYEDVELIPKLFIKANKISVVPKIGYNYLKRKGSTTQVRDNKILDNLWAYTSIKEYLINNKVYSKYSDEFKQSIQYFKLYYCRVLYDYPTLFLMRNSKRIIKDFSILEPIKVTEYMRFLKMHFTFKIKRGAYHIQNIFIRGIKSASRYFNNSTGV